MEIILGCCAGLDVHKDSVEACVRTMGAGGKVEHQVRHWGTMTGDLVQMAEWLGKGGVTHVAMESTGVYWKPIFNILEERFEILLVNARQFRNVPGRKTDIKDCQWIAQLLQHGLLKGSFIPPRPQRELRDLTRQRAQIMDERSRISNRIQKVLEDANVKLGSVASDVVGVSGRLMLEAILSGQEMTPFPSDAHLASWAGICPGNNESAGKRRSGEITKDSRWLRQALVQVAWRPAVKRAATSRPMRAISCIVAAKNEAWWQLPIRY